MSNGDEENSQSFDVDLFTEMLEAKFKKMLDQVLEPIQDELYKTQNSLSNFKSFRSKS